MRTVLNEPPEVLEAWLERRRALGQDLFDEVWEGEYHVAPAPRRGHGRVDDQLSRLLGPYADDAGLFGNGPINVGEFGNYRVPDKAYSREEADLTFVPTVAIVVEIVSPNDETWQKFDFYFARGVEELLIVDPKDQGVHWFRRGAAAFNPAEGSDLLGVTTSWLRDTLRWPPVG